MKEIPNDTLQLLEYLQDTIATAQKVPITGKSMIDKKECLDVINDIINGLPEEIQVAKWVTDRKEEILEEARREYEVRKIEAQEIMQRNIENHDSVKGAKIRAQEILADANREANEIRARSRAYADEILVDLDKEIEKKKVELIKALQESFAKTANEIDSSINFASKEIKENVKELRIMK